MWIFFNYCSRVHGWFYWVLAFLFYCWCFHCCSSFLHVASSTCIFYMLWMEFISNLPTNYRITSAPEFLQILKTTQPNQSILTALDRNFIYQHPCSWNHQYNLTMYKNNSILHPSIKPNIPKKLWHAGITKVSFYNHNDNIYTQTNGVSIGNPLGPCFSNYYMFHIENKIFKNVTIPQIYVHYVDDILAKNKKRIDHHKTPFERPLSLISLMSRVKK